MTNATRALVIAAINAGLGLAVAFHVPLSMAQAGAVITFANTVLSLWVAFTFKNSPKRVSDNRAAPHSTK